MDSEQTKTTLEEHLEALKEENAQLKKQLSFFKEHAPFDFREKYAVKILDSLPDMLTVFRHDEVGVEVVSNEETNHVGVSNKDFEGMRMCDMVPLEAYTFQHAKSDFNWNGFNSTS